MSFRRLLLCLILLVFIFVVYYSIYTNKYAFKSPLLQKTTSIFENTTLTISHITKQSSSTTVSLNYVYVWCIFAKVHKNAALESKFKLFIHSLLKYSTAPIWLNIFTDKQSKDVAENILKNYIHIEENLITYTFYDIKSAARKINNIVQTMTPYFSSQPGTYYSDALFYLSLGLHRIAPKHQKQAVMVDCDIKFVSDIQELINLFSTFDSKTLFGLAPELTPVYRHVLYVYRSKNKNTTFGDFIKSNKWSNGSINQEGYPGFNSGVVLFDLEKIRMSTEYEEIISQTNVQRLVSKYSFKGHLGDQDFFTIIGYEYPYLIKKLPCNFNRQLCTWWRDHGYSNIFDYYFFCEGTVKIYHGNCNTLIPKN